MPKKNKSKTAQKKLARKNAIIKESKDGKTLMKADNSSTKSLAKNENQHDDTGIEIPDMKITLDNALSEDNNNSYKAQLNSLSTRVDEHIFSITTLQKKLTELQMKQINLLDGCVNFLQELQGLCASNEEEEKILFETFIEIKTKIKFVFKHFLPKQVEILEREMKIHQLNNNN